MDELEEKDFIHEEYKKNPYPLWVWFIVFILVAAVAWNGRTWFQEYMVKHISSDPFLQVTNRDFSLFLWQNSEFMRANAKSKTGYLPAFQYINHVTVEPELADQYVVAPPEAIFRYHVWDRLLRKEFIPTSISLTEFKEFLKEAEEWLPLFWPQAPQAYKELVERFPHMNEQDLATLPVTTLPLEVRIAFQGWKNFYKKGEEINQLQPSYKEMTQFLASFPHYDRSFWRNILLETTPQYLKNLSVHADSDEKIPPEELASFLKYAIYNFKNN